MRWVFWCPSSLLHPQKRPERSCPCSGPGQRGADLPFQKSEAPMRCRDSTGSRFLPDRPPTRPLPVLLQAFLLIGGNVTYLRSCENAGCWSTRLERGGACIMCVSYVPPTLRDGDELCSGWLTLTLTLTEGWSRQPPSVEAIPLVRVPVLHSSAGTASIGRRSL